MKILIRADASSAIGTGHVYRCSSLAEELVRAGHQVTFVCRAQPGHLVDLLRSRGHDVHALRPTDDGRATGDRDAMETAAVASGPFDWCIVDHYGLDASFERAIRIVARHVLVIDDLADRPHDCDVLVDASHGAEDASVYDGLVPARTRRLVGQDYVLLRAAFRAMAPAPALDDVRRLLVSFGGNDPPGMTLRAVGVLKDPVFASLHIDVTSSIANPRLETLRQAMHGHDRFHFHVDTPDFHRLLRDCDLCLGAGGTTTWERFYLGKPSLVITLADNQFAFSDRLARAQLIRLVGYAPELDDEDLARALIETIADREWRRSAALSGMALIDGGGVSRVASALELH
ncbi:UDP-2,4-diacetamido-2,4,6-trideoxy-beta-L-altropyranose hydrolase [Pinisolibacter sp. B13]|uniref:UDP-2,4-diacetamido-2,4, 6-trideoxy-beta-L-altropyranose hydrolase n=1 Tax=Pinisolibacter aquiterrae TaxID=2815579 RepID=UPI001C3E4A96|nr:UDP-2,4-diacetamido-2,4,6-trideoxy-beta-L-altropyranose hydrolase [Pinisolibacter aquiterrae]MBV5265065.1 UDP-2,4-diacetamido-2,4,6-trideoxy-beta-L-altropyranose hydrolase [Pinisolibacter aquiterrae]